MHVQIAAAFAKGFTSAQEAKVAASDGSTTATTPTLVRACIRNIYGMGSQP